MKEMVAGEHKGSQEKSTVSFSVHEKQETEKEQEEEEEEEEEVPRRKRENKGEHSLILRREVSALQMKIEKLKGTYNL